MKKLLHAAALALAMLAAVMPAQAQVAQAYQNTVNNRVLTIPVTPANPLPVTCAGCSGGGSATLSPWTPDAASTVTLSPSTSSSRVALGGTGATTWVQSTGTVPAYVVLGNSSVTAALTGTLIQPGQAVPMATGTATYIAGITSSGTASLSIQTGSGSPNGVANSKAVYDFLAGDAVDGAADTGTSAKVGGKCATSSPAVESAADRVPALFDCQGRLIIRPFSLSGSYLTGLISTPMTGTTSTAVTGMGAPGSGLNNWITGVYCGNSHATVGTNIELQDGSGGTTFAVFPAGPAYGGIAAQPSTPIKQPTANTALYAKNSTTGASTTCTFTGFSAAL